MLNVDLTKMIQLFVEEGVKERMRNVPAYRKVVKREMREPWNPPKWRGNRISILFRDMETNAERNTIRIRSSCLWQAQSRGTGGRRMPGFIISLIELLDLLNNMHVKSVNRKVNCFKYTLYQGQVALGETLPWPPPAYTSFPHFYVPLLPNNSDHISFW